MAKYLLGFALGMMVAGTAMAQDAAPTPPKPAPEKKLCRAEDVTGSIIPKRICHTKSEWESIDQANRRGVDQFRDDVSRSARPQ
jgi:hypothetical protein